MKFFRFFFVSCAMIGISSAAFGTEIECVVTKCHTSNPSDRTDGSCDKIDFDKRDHLKNIETQDQLQWTQDGDLSSANGYKYSSGNLTIFDFSDGDQIKTFSFDSVDFEKFMTGQSSTLLATYVEGFDWADGFHMVYEKSLSCHLSAQN